MKLPMHSLTIRAAYTVLFGAVLAACGGGGSSEQQSATLSSGVESGRTLASTAYVPQSRGTTTPAPTTNTGEAGALTDVRFESTSSAAQTNVPVTFGQIFAPGHLAASASLAGHLDSGATIPLQLDVKATHPDGSVRHAVISAVLPSLGAGEVRTMSLVRASASSAAAPAAASALSGAGFTTSFNATIGGVRYTASADELIKKAAPKTWLNGSTVSEWEVSAPLKTSSGAEHPHLSARFAVRWYNAIRKARVDVTIENNWAYEPSPQNVTYNAQVLVGGASVYSKNALEHFHHARWRKVFWWNGAAPQVNVKHNTGYLIASRAVPNYDQSLSVPESTLSDMKKKWAAADTEPMGTGLTTTYMPQTGGRNDIGLLPQWAALYLLSMDSRVRDATLGTGELAGSFSSHYRDRNTGQPVSLIDYPYMTLLGNAGDTYNPATKAREAFPSCPKTVCDSPYTHDVSHQPSLAYLPYMLTGDHFFLEELQFWGMYNVFSSNPGYRENIKGLMKPEQVRGQAWAMRTLAQVSYITPDSDRLKQHFTRILNDNLAWYNANYTDNPEANKLGVLVNGYAVVYQDKSGVGPWQDDFFTSAIGHASDLGFTEATRLLKWKVKFPVDRMVAPGACWIDGAIYSMKIRDSQDSPFYTTMAEAYEASHDSAFNKLACGSAAMATSLKLAVGEMTGYSSGVAGYPSNMQPALAYGAEVGGASGKQAWDQFMKRSVKPNYSGSPQFAILPR